MTTSEILRDWIRGLFEQNHDFSNREITKQKFKEHFESEQNKNLLITWDKHNTLFIEQFKRICKERKIDPATFGYSNPKKTFVKVESGQVKATVTPKPKSSQTEQAQQAAQPTSPATTAMTEPEKIEITDDQSKELTKIAIKTADGIFFKKYPDAKPFSDDETNTRILLCNPVLRPLWEKLGANVLFAASVMLTMYYSHLPEKTNKKTLEKTDNATDKDFEEWKKTHGTS